LRAHALNGLPLLAPVPTVAWTRADIISVTLDSMIRRRLVC
jgi:hypothetical protein